MSKTKSQTFQDKITNLWNRTGHEGLTYIDGWREWYLEGLECTHIISYMGKKTRIDRIYYTNRVSAAESTKWNTFESGWEMTTIASSKTNELQHSLHTSPIRCRYLASHVDLLSVSRSLRLP